MSVERLRLPPPPLFTLRPPPKPPGNNFDDFFSSDLSFDQCLKLKSHLTNISSKILNENDSQIDWFHLLLRCLALITVLFCLIIAISIFICLKFVFHRNEFEFEHFFSFFFSFEENYAKKKNIMTNV